MRNEQRKEKICNAMCYIGVVTGVIWLIIVVVSIILDELQGIPEDVTLKIALLGFIPIAILGISKIVYPAKR